MHLLFDNIIFSLQQAGGISVYWSELIQRFAALTLNMRCLERPDACNNVHRATFDLQPDTILSEKTVLPLQLSRYLPCYPNLPVRGIFHSSYYRVAHTAGVYNAVTVHDFVYERFSAGLRKSVHSLQKGHAIRRAAMILCDSESTRQDLMTYYPDTDVAKVRVVYLAAADSFCPLADTAPGVDRGVPLPWTEYLLYVGDRSGYKNFPAAVETAAGLAGFGLVIAGGKPLSGSETHLLNERLPGRYIHLTGLAAADLNILYNKAHCLLYPSSYEGFGIPPLEAMQAGCPVVAVRSSSIPEVCGQAALLAEKPEPEHFLVLLAALNNSATRNNLREAGFRQAARFSWDKTFSETLSCYTEILGHRTP